MRHEPSGSCPRVQPTADRRRAPSRTRSVAVAPRYRQRALREVAHRAEASYLAVLTQHRGGGGDAA
jgi:hypothetical protein